MYVKWTGDLLRKRQRRAKVTGHSMRISRGVTARTLWGFFFSGWNSCGSERERSVITSNYWPISRSIYL